MSPWASAASIIWMPMRSFMLPPGLNYSSFARIVHFVFVVSLLSFRIGVLPINSKMLLDGFSVFCVVCIFPEPYNVVIFP